MPLLVLWRGLCWTRSVSGDQPHSGFRSSQFIVHVRVIARVTLASPQNPGFEVPFLLPSPPHTVLVRGEEVVQQSGP